MKAILSSFIPPKIEETDYETYDISPDPRVRSSSDIGQDNPFNMASDQGSLEDEEESKTSGHFTENERVAHFRKLQKGLKKDMLQVFRDAHQLPIVREKDGMQARMNMDNEGRCVSICQTSNVKIQPMRFRKFFENFDTEIVKVIPVVKEYTVCETIAEGIRVVRPLTKFPWPLTDRVMVNIEYLNMKEDKNEILYIAAGRGNEEFVERYIVDSYQKCVLASTMISGYYIRPALDN